MSEKQKVAVIREEYVAICGNYQLAIVLNQMIYWSERIKDFDSFITEEKTRLKTESLPEITFSHGWFYKSAKELSEELMTGWSERTIGRYIKKLEEFGFISSRRNPNHKWDRTLQYRINLNTIKKALESQGHKLQNYREPTPNRIGKMSDGIGKMSDRVGKMSDRNDQIVKTIPETTPENTTATTTESARSISDCGKISDSQKNNNSDKSQSQSLSLGFDAEHKRIILAQIPFLSLILVVPIFSYMPDL